MYQRIAHIALVVADYNQAIDFYTNKLGFELLEDTPLGEDKRWVIVAPRGAKECSILLARATNEQQYQVVGNQTGGRVFLFLFTDNFWRDYQALQERQVSFVRLPHTTAYGTVAVFEDLYGNQWDLIEPGNENKGLIKP